jgi:hypothetical protein
LVWPIASGGVVGIGGEELWLELSLFEEMSELVCPSASADVIIHDF